MVKLKAFIYCSNTLHNANVRAKNNAHGPENMPVHTPPSTGLDRFTSNEVSFIPAFFPCAFIPNPFNIRTDSVLAAVENYFKYSPSETNPSSFNWSIFVATFPFCDLKKKKHERKKQTVNHSVEIGYLFQLE